MLLVTNTLALLVTLVTLLETGTCIMTNRKKSLYGLVLHSVQIIKVNMVISIKKQKYPQTSNTF